MNNVVQKYRKAAMKLYGISEAAARTAIYSPKDDLGEWAPRSMAIINLETGCIPVSYYNMNFFEDCIELAGQAGVGYIEAINPAICAVYK